MTKIFQLEHFIEIHRSKRNYNHKSDCDLNIITNFIECLANLCNPSHNRSHIIHISWAACAMHARFFGLQAINCVHSSEMNLIGHVYPNVCLWIALNFNEHRTKPKSFMFELYTAKERPMTHALPLNVLKCSYFYHSRHFTTISSQHCYNSPKMFAFNGVWHKRKWIFFLFQRMRGGRLHTSEMALEFNESNVFPVAVCVFHHAVNEIFLKIERQLLILFCFCFIIIIFFIP